MAEKLKPCPFCGGDEAHAALADYADGATAHVECDTCGCKVYGYGRGERGLRDAVESWNRCSERKCHYFYDREICAWTCSGCDGLEPVGDNVRYCPDYGARVVEEEA